MAGRIPKWSALRPTIWGIIAPPIDAVTNRPDNVPSDSMNVWMAPLKRRVMRTDEKKPQAENPNAVSCKQSPLLQILSQVLDDPGNSGIMVRTKR